MSNAERVLIGDRKIGIEVEVESSSVNHTEVQRLLTGPMSSGLWELDTDGEGSLRAGALGWEVRTSGNGQTLNNVRTSMHELYPLLTHSTGIWRAAVHTHVSLEGLNSLARGYLLALSYCVDDNMFERFSPERRESNFCVPLANDSARTVYAIEDYLQSDRPSGWCKYTSVNIQAEERFGTFEYRHMKTPACDGTIQGVRESLRLIWDYAHTCAKLVDYVYRCVGGKLSLASVLNSTAVYANTGMLVDPRVVYHVLDSVTEAKCRALTESDIDTIVGVSKTTPPRSPPVTNPDGEEITALEWEPTSGELYEAFEEARELGEELTANVREPTPAHAFLAGLRSDRLQRARDRLEEITEGGQ